MNRSISVVLIFVMLALSASAQSSYSDAETVPAFLPNSATDVYTVDVRVTRLWLANTTGSAVTVTLIDKGTGCNGSACQLWPTVSIAANSVQSVDMGGLWFRSGLQWSASSSNAVIGYLKVRK